MAQNGSPSPIDLKDYDAIERAVMETERGRWFLAEFARRNRSADTKLLLDAIDRLQQAVSAERWVQDIDRIREGLREMATMIVETKSRVAAPPFDSLERSGADPLTVVARTTERVASNLAATASEIHDAASAFRGEGVKSELCDSLARQATEVSTAATIQDLASHRIAAIVETLRGLEARIGVMITTCDEPEAPRAAGRVREAKPHLQLVSRASAPAESLRFFT